MSPTEQSYHHGPERVAEGGSTLLFLALFLLGLITIVKLSGCASKSPAEAENLEIRLTQDEVMKQRPMFSPDGAWIAYSARYGPDSAHWGIFLVSAKGGGAKRVSPDSIDVGALTWAADGKSLYARGADGSRLYSIGLDGTTRFLATSEALSGFVGISADGQTQLLIKFVGDNRELAMRHDGGKLKVMAATPAWEEGATFGPGPGEVTAYARPSYQAPTSTMSIWSPKTRTFTSLPLPEGLNYDPSWSPGGRFLAFSTYRGGQSDVWFYDQHTTRAQQITSDAEDEACPSWSPDGKWLVFCRSARTSHIVSGEPGQDDRHQLTSGASYDYSPVVSPDGRWVAFFRRPPADSSRSDAGPSLCVMPAAGGPVETLDLGGLVLGGKGSSGIAWSADARELAFQGSDGSGKLDIYRIGRDGRGLARVTVGPGDEVDPMWSPDGRFISYTQAGGGKTQVMVIPSNGGIPVAVSHQGSTSEGSTWSPSGDRIAYVTYTSDGTYEVWTALRANPTDRERVVEDRDIAYPVFWSKDGKELILARRVESAWLFSAVPTHGGPETMIGKETPLKGGHGMYCQLNPSGEKFRNLFYPGGVCVFTDGKESSDLYLLRVRDVIGDRASGPRSPSLSSMLLAARAE